MKITITQGEDASYGSGKWFATQKDVRVYRTCSDRERGYRHGWEFDCLSKNSGRAVIAFIPDDGHGGPYEYGGEKISDELSNELSAYVKGLNTESRHQPLKLEAV